MEHWVTINGKRVIIEDNLHKATSEDINGDWSGLNKNAAKYFESWKNANEDERLIYKTSKGKAFIRLQNNLPLAKILALGSTGDKAGTKALIATLHLVNNNKNNKLGVTWNTDNSTSESYYDYLGLTTYK